jgi:hypothetical protein
LSVLASAVWVTDAVSAGTCQAPQTTAMRSKPSRVAARIAWRMWASRRCSRGGSVTPLAQGGHRLGDRVERRRLVGRAGAFDAVLPPALGVLVARRGGDRADRVALDRAEPAAPALLVVGALDERRAGGQVDEAKRHVAVQRVAQRAPLRREARERVVQRAAGIVAGVDEQRHRRLEPLAGAYGTAASPSGGPSTSTASGSRSRRTRSTLCAEPGP